MGRTAKLLLLAAVASCLAAASPTFKGRTLADVLQELQRDGLRLIYSSELIRPEMVVTAEPRGRWPREILDELLAVQGLRAEPGPAGSLLVVKAPAPGSIAGSVSRAGSRDAVPGVEIVALGTAQASLSDTAGRFATGPLPPGTYALEVRCPGYKPQRVEVPVRSGAVTEVRLQLHPRRLSLEEVIVVRAADEGGTQPTPELRQALGRDAILASPEVANDPLLPAARLSGVASTDGSGGLNVRGGSSQELKLVLDGLELYQPFHLQERGGLISLVDARNIGGMELLGGAFPADYGGHMSGVVELQTLVPPDGQRTELALSTNDARVANQGSLNDRLSWLISARHGDPAQLLEAIGADGGYEPRYWDLFGRVVGRPSDRTTLTLDLLAGDEDVEGDDFAPVHTTEEPGTFRSRHTSRYLWLTLEHAGSAHRLSRTMLSVGQLASERFGSNPQLSAVEDARSTQLLGLKQDWLFESGRQLVRFGLDAKQLQADYDYSAAAAGDALPHEIRRRPRGADLGAYVTDRLRAGKRLDVEFGLRWDLQTYTDERQGALSPRLNVRYRLGERTTLRAGWGYFYQQQKIHELQVEDGLDGFAPPERAEHRLLSWEHVLESGLRLQLNAYQKRMCRLRPRYENLFDPFGFFPEGDADRVRIAPEAARAEGLELLLGGASWWAAYTLSRAEDRIDGDWQPRSWDQRHALDAGLRWKPGERWELTFAGSYHSGRPTTPVSAVTRPRADGSLEIVPILGTRNSTRLPSYERVDLRVRRFVPIRGTELQVFASVSNVFDRHNVCCVADFDYTLEPDGSVDVTRQTRHGLSRLLTLGLSWAF
ncbi:MAG TPA: TonB-dependent receptor [Candidatus Polarisedimenticolaceae bacterium]|nr:TonB-dependent receptor [Candidatus Polarisedimenticolaceae bacterium]